MHTLGYSGKSGIQHNHSNGHLVLQASVFDVEKNLAGING